MPKSVTTTNQPPAECSPRLLACAAGAPGPLGSGPNVLTRYSLVARGACVIAIESLHESRTSVLVKGYPS